MDIEKWLLELGLERYTEAFNENFVDGEILSDLTADDLREMGVSAVGHRRKLLKAIEKLSPAIEQLDENHSSSLVKDIQNANTQGEAERRHLTVMFVDMVGSTELTSRIDPEEARDVITRFQNTVAGASSRFEGFVARFMGDGVLCYFGWPRANEDDAERAVRAGLSIVESVKKIRLSGDTSVAVRIGIASGLVVVGDLIGSGASEEAAVVGETPNLAARLQSLANPDQLVLPLSTKKLLKSVFKLTSVGTHHLKGIEKPVEAFVVAGEEMHESRFAAHRATTMIPLAGRALELELIYKSWAQIIKSEGQMIVISGEAGIGKSRIVQAAITGVKTECDLTCLTFQCSPYHMESALFPVIHQILNSSGIESTDSSEQRFDKVKVYVGEQFEDVSLIATMLGIDSSVGYTLPELTPTQLRARTMQALIDILVRSAYTKPLFLIFEDLHWVDPTTLEFLDLLADVIGKQRILVLATTRPNFTHSFEAHGNVRQVPLNRLTQDQAVSIIEKLTDGKEIPQEILQIIVQRTDGIPLFVEELTKTILESGVLTDTDNRYVLDRPAAVVSIPATLHDSLMARLDRLEVVKDVAQIASCIGREFSHKLLLNIAPLSSEELDFAVRKLIGAELVFQRGSPDNRYYQFKHSLVRDAAYESLLKPRRRQIHSEILCALESYPDTSPEVQAAHAESAGLIDKAVDLWAQASDIAVTRPAFDEAIADLLRAIHLLKPRIEQHDPTAISRCLPLQVQLGVVYMSCLGWAADETKASFEAASALDDGVGYTPMRFSILYGLCAARYARGELREAIRHGQTFVDLAEDAPETAPSVVANRAYGVSLFLVGEFLNAQRFFDRSVELFDSDLHSELSQNYGQDLGVGTYGVVSLNLLLLGRTQQAYEYLKKCMHHGRNCGNVLSECYAQLIAELFAIYTENTELMALHAANLEKLSNDNSVLLFQQYSGMSSALVMLDRGDIKGLRAFENFEADIMNTRTRQFLPHYCLSAAARLIDSGMIDEACALAERAKNILDKTHEHWMLAEYYRVLAKLSLHVNNTVVAEENLQKSLETARYQGAKLFELRAVIDIASMRVHHQIPLGRLGALINDAKSGVKSGDCEKEISAIAQFSD